MAIRELLKKNQHSGTGPFHGSWASRYSVRIVRRTCLISAPCGTGISSLQSDVSAHMTFDARCPKPSLSITCIVRRWIRLHKPSEGQLRTIQRGRRRQAHAIPAPPAREEELQTLLARPFMNRIQRMTRGSGASISLGFATKMRGCVVEN
jgi:hypothetical protein